MARRVECAEAFELVAQGQALQSRCKLDIRQHKDASMLWSDGRVCNNKIK